MTSFEREMKTFKGGKKLVMLTAYDAQVAHILSGADVDLILVGDSLGVVFQGLKTTKQVTMDEMVYHITAVRRGAGAKPVIGDMPAGSFDTPELALRNAQRFMAAGTVAVKIEGDKPDIVRALAGHGIPVMGHLGLLPQTAESYRVQGKTEADAQRIMEEARRLDAAGVFALVLECVPEILARNITRTVTAPTIGIGAGAHCDGQVLVINDMLGMEGEYMPKFVKHYAELGRIIKSAVDTFAGEVREGLFPDSSHTYH
jgi:3-methyl-2-oxobutanoate hydroxymethyltransferase